MPEASPVRIGTSSYARWWATTLGALTDALEERLITELLGEVDGRQVLDAGCGDGALARTLARHGASVVGLDADSSMVEAARRAAADAGLEATFVAGELARLPFPDASFDVVVAVTVLCFVPDATASIRELVRVLRPGGRLVLGELGRWSAWAALRRARGDTTSDLRSLPRLEGANQCVDDPECVIRPVRPTLREIVLVLGHRVRHVGNADDGTPPRPRERIQGGLQRTMSPSGSRTHAAGTSPLGSPFWRRASRSRFSGVTADSSA